MAEDLKKLLTAKEVAGHDNSQRFSLRLGEVRVPLIGDQVIAVMRPLAAQVVRRIEATHRVRSDEPTPAEREDAQIRIADELAQFALVAIEGIYLDEAGEQPLTFETTEECIGTRGYKKVAQKSWDELVDILPNYLIASITALAVQSAYFGLQEKKSSSSGPGSGIASGSAAGSKTAKKPTKRAAASAASAKPEG